LLQNPSYVLAAWSTAESINGLMAGLCDDLGERLDRAEGARLTISTSSGS